MREGLCHDISLRPYSGRRKVAILDDADCLNAEGANSLLKTLEEPPVDSLLILIGTNLQRQLPTIRSRCQAIIFRALDNEQLAKLLLNSQVPSMDTAQDLASMSGGSLTEASLLADPELHSFREKLLGLLSSSQLPMQELAKSCGGVVDAAGKDSKLKRERLKMLIRIAATFYRGLALRQHASASSHPPVGDQALNQAVAQAERHWLAGPVAATACWQRCLLAIEQVDRNANQASLLECLAADLAQISST